MPLPENKSMRLAVIPWIMAIIALVGLNALASVHRFTKKQESSHESALSELSDDVVARGGVCDPLVFVEQAASADTPTTGISPFVPVALPELRLIDTGFTTGRVQGRAPPSVGRA
ncbi:MAG: hypothetical protein EOP85_04555 [Verrucomicrobiaceae bacterium]|nr:MAG: hypothetical protein EOP85_04555 [Verrucomicrobiaceae bacterium]